MYVCVYIYIYIRHLMILLPDIKHILSISP